MSVSYIGQLIAREGEIENFRKFFESVVMPAVKGSEGNISCELFQEQENPAKFLVVETWHSIDSHRASIRNIPQQATQTFMTLIAEPPKGGHYDSIARL